MSNVDPATYEKLVAQENAAAMRKAAELDLANQRAMHAAGLRRQGAAAAPKAPQYREPAALELPSNLTFEELQERISSALADYKQREADLIKIRESLRKAQVKEAAAVQRSLRNDDAKILDEISRARLEAETASRRITVGEQAFAAEGLTTVTQLLQAGQAMLIKRISELSTERTRAHYEVLVNELDAEAIDRFAIHAGLGRGPGLLWRLAGLGSDVLELQAFHPHLGWLHPGLSGRTMQRLEEDAERLFNSITAFENHVGKAHEQIER
jgi:hypothetical protein